MHGKQANSVLKNSHSLCSSSPLPLLTIGLILLCYPFSFFRFFSLLVVLLLALPILALPILLPLIRATTSTLLGFVLVAIVRFLQRGGAQLL